MNKFPSVFRLLPNYFKKIAIGLLLLSIALIVVSKFQSLGFNIEMVKTIGRSGILISFLIFARTADKIEDELIYKIRINAFASAFIFGVFFVILQPWIDILFKGDLFSKTREIGTFQLLGTMFLFYFGTFYSMKKKR
jgi:hypothetical protein